MNIFETVKMRHLLNKRYKLKTELLALERADYNLYDNLVYSGGMSAERWFQINNEFEF